VEGTRGLLAFRFSPSRKLVYNNRGPGAYSNVRAGCVPVHLSGPKRLRMHGLLSVVMSAHLANPVMPSWALAFVVGKQHSSRQLGVVPEKARQFLEVRE
jgi:hypothetical protein